MYMGYICVYVYVMHVIGMCITEQVVLVLSLCHLAAASRTQPTVRQGMGPRV